MVLSPGFRPWLDTLRIRGAGHSFAAGWGLVLVTACLLLCGCARQQSTVASRSEKAERLSVEARQARERGDLKSAETLLTAAVERNPNDYELRLELSELLLVHHKTQAASSHLQMLLQKNPEDPRVYVGLSEVQYLKRNLSEADALVADALDLDPRQTRALLLRAKIEQARGNIDRALEDLYQILDVEGDHIEAKLLVARLHLQQGDSRLAASEMRALIESPTLESESRGKAQWLLGRCYTHDERWPEAATALTAGISSRQGSPRDWCLVADVCRRAGDPSGAEQAIENALRLSPSNSQAIAFRASLNDDARMGHSSSSAVARISHLDDEDDPLDSSHRNPIR
ncbi:MAG TPA: tetratricopeptide repeat protein [Planctomycetaceae bacterium]|jgi:predicted Zn-dependent protease